MKKKVVFILILFFVSLFTFSFYQNWRNHIEDKSLYIKNMNQVNVEDLLRYGFQENENVTVGQCLTFLCRAKGYDVKNFDEVIEVSEKLGVLLPASLVYSEEEWKALWTDIIKGNTIFEKVNEDTYVISLIPNYYSIYLNQQGYEYIKQGLIPPQLYFYSPFSSIQDLESINLSKKANLGFVLDVLMSYKVEQNKTDIIKTIIVEKVEGLVGVKEKDWGSNEIALYNYYALNYYGEYSYLKTTSDLSDIPFDSLSSFLSINDFLILFDKIK